MTPSCKLVWVFLSASADKAGEVGISIESMCASLGLSRGTVIDAIRALVKAGCVQRVRLGRQHTPNVYRVVQQPLFLMAVA